VPARCEFRAAPKCEERVTPIPIANARMHVVSGNGRTLIARRGSIKGVGRQPKSRASIASHIRRGCFLRVVGGDKQQRAKTLYDAACDRWLEAKRAGAEPAVVQRREEEAHRLYPNRAA
jgi:hypothetical protein